MTRLLTIAAMMGLVFLSCAPACAADKMWTGLGDGTSWFDDENWSPEGTPTTASDARIDLSSAAPAVSQTFYAKSLTLGGTAASSLTVNTFISGTVAPDKSTDVAVHNRRDGTLTLKGSTGTVTLNGTYKDSEETLASQPSLVFFVE